MAAKMAVKEIFPETGKVQGSACKMLILLILELLASSLLHPSGATHVSLRIKYIQDDFKDSS